KWYLLKTGHIKTLQLQFHKNPKKKRKQKGSRRRNVLNNNFWKNIIMNRLITIFSIFIMSVSFLTYTNEKPVFYIIGDSTVKNGDGTGKNNQMGWGTVITPFF